MELTLEAFKQFCDKRYPGVPITEHHDEPFPDWVLYDCKIYSDVILRFCPVYNMYTYSRVIILGKNWRVEVDSIKKLAYELTFVDEAEKLRKGK